MFYFEAINLKELLIYYTCKILKRLFKIELDLIRSPARLISRVIKNKKPLIIDVGSHKGESIDEFIKYFKDPLIFGFEPQKENYIFCVKKYQDNKNIKIFNYALSKDTKKKIFYINHRSLISGFNQTMPRKYKNSSTDISLKGVEIIKPITLNNFFTKKKKIKNNIDILKIDAEGHDFEVLIGCSKILFKTKVVIIEVQVGSHFKKKTPLFKFDNYFVKKNFKLFSIIRSGNLYENSNLYFDLIYINKRFI
jgi:FkbM family methyltransferase